MKSILIIGMGKFGHHLCANLAKLDNEIMVVDEKEEMLEDLLPIVTSAKIGDCTNEDVLRSLGVRNFDICFVCIKRTGISMPSFFCATGRMRLFTRIGISLKSWRSG